MPKRECQRDERPPRVPEHDRLLDTELYQCAMHDIGLGVRCPEAIARTFAVAETRSVECDDAVALRQTVRQSARNEIFQAYDITVQKDHGSGLAAVDVVEAHAVCRHESPKRWTS